MARPKPTIVLHWEDSQSYAGIDICEAEGFSYFAVLYKNRPFQLRKHLNVEVTQPGNIKYPKTVFANAGHAFNLADRLNEKFCTTDFTVHQLTHGREIQRH
jgi:hypothetical protein